MTRCNARNQEECFITQLKKKKGKKDELLNTKYPTSNGCINYSFTAVLCDFQSEKGTLWPQVEAFDGFSA